LIGSLGRVVGRECFTVEKGIVLRIIEDVSEKVTVVAHVKFVRYVMRGV
jgi:hypothetical protein